MVEGARVTVIAIIVRFTASRYLVELATHGVQDRTILHRTDANGARVVVVATDAENITMGPKVKLIQTVVVDASLVSECDAVLLAVRRRIAEERVGRVHTRTAIEAVVQRLRVSVRNAGLPRSTVAFIRQREVDALSVQAVVQRSDVVGTGRPVAVSVLLPNASRRAILGLLAALQSLRLLLFDAFEFELAGVVNEIALRCPARSRFPAVGVIMATLVENLLIVANMVEALILGARVTVDAVGMVPATARGLGHLVPALAELA